MPLGQYAIFGSGSMAIRGIREAQDIDVMVLRKLWDRLVAENPLALRHDPEHLLFGNVEVFREWRLMTGLVPTMIAEADIIDGLPFVKLKYTIEWKQLLNRDKDRRDVELIRAYLKQHPEVA